MVIDVHCHVGWSARRADPAMERFSFEAQGARGSPGFDSYFSPRLLARSAWFFVRRWLGIERGLGIGPELDAAIDRIYERHFSEATSVDRLVLLAFDEYHDNAGTAIGPAARGARIGSDLFVSNTLVRNMCRRHPRRYLFGASIHPYRTHNGRDACALLEEIAASGAVLIKWLPIHQNIDITDRRTVAFCRRAAELKLPLLIHYGGEMSLSRQHLEFESPLPFLEVYRKLKAAGRPPTVIVAHAATPSFWWQNSAYHRAFLDALLGEFADDPLYADISALAAFGRTGRLCALARRPELHRKLLFGSDFPIPVMLPFFAGRVSRAERRAIGRLPSWIEQDYQLKRALGFSDCVFTQAADLLPPGPQTRGE